MSREIDEKVVSMQFDNANFEKNVKTSMSTIDKLKSKLNFDSASKGFEKIEDESSKVNLGGIKRAIEETSTKFTLLGSAANAAIFRIVNDSITAGKQLAKSLSVDQIAEGWKKYDLKTNNVQTIVNSTGKSVEQVNDYLDKLIWFSDETSYGFTDMTQALSTMTSSGGDIEKLIPMVMGVANAVAFAGKGASEFSRVMYNLNQSYGRGFLTSIDWMSVQQAGAASKQLQETLIAAGEELGTIKKGDVTLSNFKDSLQNGKTKGWATTAVMEKAFGEFAKYSNMAYDMVQSGEVELASEAYKKLAESYNDVYLTAAKAAQEAKTFKEAIDATKDAVSSKWAQTFEIIFGDYERAKETWTDLANGLWDIFASGGDDRNELLRKAFLNPWDQITSRLKDANVDVDDFVEKLKQSARSHGITIDEWIAEDGTFEKTLERGWLSGGLVSEALAMYINNVKKVDGTTEDLTEKLKYFQTVVDKVWNGDYKNGEERIKALTKAGYEYADVQKLVNMTVDGHRLTLNDLSDAELIAIGYTEEEIKTLKILRKEAARTGTELNTAINNAGRISGQEHIAQAINNLIEAVSRLKEIVSKAWTNIFGEIDSEKIYSLAEGIDNLTAKLIPNKEQADKLCRTLEGLFSILDIIKTLIVGAFSKAINAVKKVLNYFGIDILGITAKIGDQLVKLKDWIKSNESLQGTLDRLHKIISNITSAIKQWIQQFTEIPIVNNAIETVKNKFSNFGDEANNSIDSVNQLLDKLVDKTAGLNNISLTDIIEKIKNLFTTARDSISGVLDSISNYRTKIFSLTAGTESNVTNTLTNLTGQFSNFFGNIKKDFDFSNIGSGFFGVLDRIKKFFTEKFDLNALTKIIIGGAMVVGINNLGKSIGKLLKPLDQLISSVKDIVSSIKNIASSIQTYFKAKAWTEYGKVVLLFASAILILAGAIWLLSTVSEPDRLWNAVGAIAVMMVLLGALFAEVTLLTKNFKASQTLSIAAIVISLGLALLAFAAMVSIINNTLNKSKDPKKLIWMIVVIGAVFAALMGVLLLASKLSKSIDFIGVAVSMAAAVLAISSLIGAVVLLGILPQAIYSKGLKNLAILAAIVGGIAFLMGVGSVGPLGNNAKSMAVALLAAVAAITLLVGTVTILALIPQEMIDSGMSKLQGLVNAIVTMVAIMSVFTAGPLGKNLKGAADFALKFSLAIILLIAAILIVSYIPQKDIKNGLASISGIALVLESFMAVFSIFTTGPLGENMDKAAKVLKSMAVLFAIIGIIMVVATFFDVEKMLAVSFALTLIIDSIAILMSTAKNVDGTEAKTLLSIAAIVLVIGAFISAVLLLTKDSSWSQIGMAATVIAASLVVLLAIALFLEFIENKMDARKITDARLKAIIKVSAIVLGIMVAIGGLMIGLGALAKEGLINAEGTQAAGAAAVIAAGVVYISSLILKAIQSIPKINSNEIYKKIGALDVVAASIIGIAALIAVVSMIPMGDVGKVTVVLAESVGVFAAAAALVIILSKVGKGISGAAGEILLAAGIIDLVIVILGALVVGIGALDAATDGGLSSWCERAVGIFESIGKAFGALFAGLLKPVIDLFTEAIVNTFKSICTVVIATVRTVIEDTKGLIEYIQNELSESDLAKVALFTAILNALGNGMRDIAKGSILAYISDVINFFGGKSIGERFIEMGNVVNGFIKSISGITTGDVVKGSVAASVINSLGKTLKASAASNLLDTLGSLFGGSSKDFGEKLKSFGEGVGTFIKSIDNQKIDLKQVEKAKAAAEIVAKLYETLPKEGGLMGAIFGEADMGRFGVHMGDLGAGIASFIDSISKYDFGDEMKNKMDNAIEIAKGIVEIANAIPAGGGLLQKFTGMGDFPGFSKDIVTFAKGMVGFAKQASRKDLAGFDKSISDKAIAIANDVVTMISALPNTGGMWQSFFGKQDLGNFATNLPTLGQGIANFAMAIHAAETEIDSSAIDEAIKVAGALATLSDSLPANFTFEILGAKIKLTSMSPEEFKNNIVNFAGAVVGFSKEIKENGSMSNTAAINRAIDVLIRFSDLNENLPDSQSWISKFFTGDDAKNFGKSLGYYGEGLNKFYTNLTNPKNGTKITSIDDELVDKSVSALDALSKISISVSGLTNLQASELLATYLTNLGTSLVTYANVTKDISDLKQLTSVADLSRRLVNVAVSCENVTDNGFWGFYHFASNLKTFGENLKDFYENLSGINASKLQNIISKVEIILDLSDSVSQFATNMTDLGKNGLNSFISQFALPSNLTKLRECGSKVITYFINGLKNRMNSGSDGIEIMFNDVSNMLPNIISNKIGAYSESGRSVISTFIEGMKSAMNVRQNVNSLEQIVKKVASKFGNNDAEFVKQGENAFLKYLGGFLDDTSLKTNMPDKIKSVVNAVKNKLGEYPNKFKSVGENFYMGLTMGMDENEPKVTNIVKKHGNAWYKTLCETLKIHSPSLLTYEAGKFFDLGFSNAISDYSNSVSGNVRLMGDEAANTLTNSMANLNDLLMNNVDDQPVIRPVVDLTDVEEKQRILNGFGSNGLYMRTLYNSAYKTSGAFNASRASAIQESQIQNGQDSSTTISNVFHITGDNPKEIANEVSKILQQQVNRRNAVWGT